MKRQKIDWDNVRKQLAENQAALERALVPGPDRLAAVYNSRALQLANRKAVAQETSDGAPIQVFSFSGQSYGLELAAIVEILPEPRYAQVPGAPPEFLGVANIRGELRAVVDPARLLGQSSGKAGDASGFLLVLQGRDQHEIALRVDRLGEIRTLQPGDLLPPPDADNAPQTHCIKGLASDGVALLDAAALLSHPVFATPTPTSST